MARDIHNVADDVSLVMREVIDATENAMVLETALHLSKGSKSTNAKDYIKTQVASKRQLNNRLQQVANKSQKMLNNVIDNIGSYTGTNTKQLKKDTTSGMKMLVRSAKSMQNKTLKKVSRLERYKTSAEFIPNLDKSIISQTKLGIEKGLPVTYKNGRKVSYKAYMEMAVRTGIQQEIGDRQLEAGRNANIVFYVVNEFGDCADDHANYQGKMYYDEGYTDFPLQDEIKGLIQDHIQKNGLLSIQAVRDKPPYLTTRPNCRHKMKPVAIDRVLQESVENIKDDLGYKTKSYRPENYEATKEQRYNERNIRKYKQRNLTYMALYKKTNNKEYLIQAQKEKRQVALWQKRQRQHMKANPDLFRDYERENPKVLLQDLGLTNKKIQVDPNKPPTPITNKPPQTPPVAMSEVVKEHLEIPEQKTDMFTKPQDIVVNFSKPNDTWLKSKQRKEHYDSYTNFIKNNFVRSNDMVSVSLEKLFKKQTELMPNMKFEYTSGTPNYTQSFNTIKVQSQTNGNENYKFENNRTTLHEIGHSIEGNIGNEIFGSKVWSVTDVKYYEDDLRKFYKKITKKTRIPFNEEDFKKRIKRNYSDIIDGFDKKQKEIFDLSLEYSDGIDKYRNKKILLEKQTYTLLKGQTEELKKYKTKQEREEWLKENVEYKELSDMYDGLSSGSFLRQGISKYGHGSAYWKKDRGKAGTEIFTELSSLKTLKPDVYDMFKKDFPEIVEPYEKIILKSTQYLEEKYGK